VQAALQEREALARAVAQRLHATAEGDFFCHPYAFDLIARGDAEATDRPVAVTLTEVIADSRARAGVNAATVGFAVDLQPLQEGRPDLEIRATEMAESATGRTGPVILTGAEAVAGMGVTLAAAFGLIAEAWPDLAAEITCCLDVLNIFRSTNATSFTDYRNHGSIFVSADYASNHAGLAEAIAHEAGHVRLNGFMSCFRCVADDGGLHPTPLRKDPRPAIGLFHQAYVLRRTVELHARQPDGWTDSYRQLCRQQFSEALAEAAELPLTQTGQELLDELSRGDLVTV
jgi:HEXXH motif-containing protein